MRHGVNLTVRCWMLVCALGTATVATAQDPSAAQTDPAQAAAPTASPDVPSAEVASPGAAEQTAPVPVAEPAPAPAPVSAFPPPPPPPQATVVYQPATPRVVMLVPQKRAVRPRPKRVYGDAGAPFAIGAGLTFTWPSDAGYARSGHDDLLTHGEIFASYDVWQPVDRLVLAAGAHFRALMGGNERVEVRERAIQADLTLRYTAARWLFPHLRAGVGAVGTTLQIDDTEPYRTGLEYLGYEDKDWAPVGTLGAGFTLRTRARAFESHSGHVSSLSLGLLVEGGYIVAPAAKLDLQPTGSPASGIETRTAKAGSLDRTAPYLRIAGVVRF